MHIQNVSSNLTRQYTTLENRIDALDNKSESLYKNLSSNIERLNDTLSLILVSLNGLNNSIRVNAESKTAVAAYEGQKPSADMEMIIQQKRDVLTIVIFGFVLFNAIMLVLVYLKLAEINKHLPLHYRKYYSKEENRKRKR